MPKCSEPTVYRGTRDLPPGILAQYVRDKVIVWSAFSSATWNLGVLSNPMFHGPVGNRTKFLIEGCDAGILMDRVSAHQVEDEVLLPPGLAFRVVAVLDCGAGLTEVQLKADATAHRIVPPPSAQFLACVQ
mmetsp:Transcript_74794/g.175580  ORF Transcript_74794/g.175580 Transcript_74794/m.175580 type:complete len:131 (-) Transcript_74794:33-425(-)